MKEILIDQWSLAEPGSDRGLGRYANEVLGAVLTSDQWLPVELLRTATKRGVDQIQIYKRLREYDRQIAYHAMSVYHLPVVKDRHWICSIQDIIPLDLSAYRTLGLKSRALFANARRSDLIIANSAYTAMRIHDRLHIAMDRIRICPLGVSPIFSSILNTGLSSEIVSGRYVVGLADGRTPDPRKRYHWIDQVGDALSNSGVQMVVTGRGLSSADFPNCVLLESLTDEGLARLYANAIATFYPSAYEGQGLPPLEAMAAGCPAIAFDNTSVSEMVAGGGFLLDDPVPWRRQALDAPMPQSSISIVVSKIEELAAQDETLAKARQRARDHVASMPRLVEGLSAAYSEGVRSREER